MEAKKSEVEHSNGEALSEYKGIYEKIARKDLANPIQGIGSLEKKARFDLSRLPSLRGKKVLEIGPGLGHLSRLVFDRAAELHVTDVVSDYIDVLKADLGIHGWVGDAQSMDVQEAYDLIIVCDVLEHVFRPTDVLISAFRALKPGGMLYVRVPSWEALVNYSRFVGCEYEYVHFRTYTTKLLALELLSVGFSLRRGPTGKGAPTRLLSSWFFPKLTRPRKASEIMAAYGGEQSVIFSANERLSIRAMRLLEILVTKLRVPLISLPSEVWALASKPLDSKMPW